MTRALAALALAALVALPGQALAEYIGNIAIEPPCIADHPCALRVLDGDTLEIGGLRIRIWGVDAPEKSQTCEGQDGTVYHCGLDATAVMVELTRGQAVTCTPKDRDRYGRTVAVCYTAAGDLGEAMVRRGWAIDYSRYSHGAYRAAEDAAKTERLGMWAGRFEMPAAWRRAHKR